MDIREDAAIRQIVGFSGIVAHVDVARRLLARRFREAPSVIGSVPAAD
jgi:hypothetical protein